MPDENTSSKGLRAWIDKVKDIHPEMAAYLRTQLDKATGREKAREALLQRAMARMDFEYAILCQAGAALPPGPKEAI